MVVKPTSLFAKLNFDVIYTEILSLQKKAIACCLISEAHYASEESHRLHWRCLISEAH